MPNRGSTQSWPIVALEEVAEVRTGLAKGQKTVTSPVKRPYLRVANVQDGFLELSEIKTIEVGALEVGRYQLRAGDVLLTEGGDFDKLDRGTVWRGEIEGCLHQNHVFVVRADSERLLPEFLAYQTASRHGKRYFMTCSKQSTNLASINSAQLKQFPLPLPPCSEQRRIAEVLRTWDNAIATTELLIEQKKRRQDGLLEDLARGDFGRGFGNEKWIETSIKDIMSPAFRRVAWDDSATYRLITVKRACGGIIFRGDRKGEEIQTKEMYAVQAGDFVISKRQVVHGAWAMAKADFDGTHVSKEYACFVPRADKLWMPFFDWLSRTKRLRHQAFLCSYGVDIEKMVLDMDWLREIRLQIPSSLDQQKRIAELFDCVESEIALLRRKQAALKRQKRGLMQKLLTGAWRFTPNNSCMPSVSRKAAE